MNKFKLISGEIIDELKLLPRPQSPTLTWSQLTNKIIEIGCIPVFSFVHNYYGEKFCTYYRKIKKISYLKSGEKVLCVEPAMSNEQQPASKFPTSDFKIDMSPVFMMTHHFLYQPLVGDSELNKCIKLNPFIRITYLGLGPTDNFFSKYSINHNIKTT